MNKMFAKTIVISIVILLSACEQNNNSSPVSLALPDTDDAEKREEIATQSLLERIEKRGKLIVLTTNNPTTYFFDRDNELAGPEYDMTQSFAKSLDLPVEYKVYNSTKDVLIALRENEGDLAASSLTVTVARKKEFDFGPVYQKTEEHIVCYRDAKRITKTKDMDGIELIVTADSSYIKSLEEYPELQWVEDNHLGTAVLMEQVAAKKIECTVSDSILYDIERRYHTEIQKKYTLNHAAELAWVFNKHSPQLLSAVNQWFVDYKSSKDLSHMLDKYYGYVEIFDYVDTHKFLNRVKTRLPQYKAFFKDAAIKNDIEPSLLAAQSYQESHWNRKAKSPTGVRGIMMLTQPVAKSLGVTNRLHAKQNIYAGAKFHAKMKKMVEHVAEPDRTWLALAAYNVGRGHFRDAQSLARKLNKDPDRWFEMKQVLPLLSKEKYYKDLRYGYARGNEPVRYVTRIRNYDELLHAHFGGDKAKK